MEVKKYIDLILKEATETELYFDQFFCEERITEIKDKYQKVISNNLASRIIKFLDTDYPKVRLFGDFKTFKLSEVFEGGKAYVNIHLYPKRNSCKLVLIEDNVLECIDEIPKELEDYISEAQSQIIEVFKMVFKYKSFEEELKTLLESEFGNDWVSITINSKTGIVLKK